jgi:kumamolisin
MAWKGSGGGVSGYWKRPSWQHGPGVPASEKRNTADVALNADPATGYSFRFEGKWVVYGGTSVAAPEWAALWILIDEAANKRIGNANELIYEMGRSADYGKVFYDITRGDNGNYWGPGYKAGANWDHPTGWGVPNGEALLNWVVKAQKPANP